MKNNQYSGFEVAVVGISFRTSEALNWRDFWENLASSKESLHFLTDEELINLELDNSFIKDKNYVNCTPNLIDKDCFDSNFFEYSNEEAKMMYPAHRFFHECVWEALEDAGCNPDDIKESIGVYAGAGDDLVWKTFVNISRNNKVNDFYLSKISNKDYLSSLVSYKLGLTGPSMTLNTACSTSLVAIHMACKALIFGETKIALAGASSLMNVAQKGYLYEEGSIFSKDGHCKAFDQNSTGTVDGEGAGVVVLKRLKDAIADRDNIYAIIKGSAINNDGNRKVGYTAPSVEGQVTCIKMAHKFAKVEPETISYIETHGTGTKLGDSIEVEALNAAFDKNTSFSCPIGSVKTNIGHLDTASGVAGFIKTVLSIKNKKIPATLHFNKADSNINFQEGPFFVNDKLSEWKTINGNPLRAGVNSFGVGGTNAHIILEEAPEKEEKLNENDFNLMVLSAKTETSLKNYLDKLTRFLSTEEGLNLSDMCYTFQLGRKSFDTRTSISFKNKAELQQKLDDIVKQGKPFAKIKNAKKSIVFVFPGQGSQYINMGKDLYESNFMFRESMDKGFELLHKIMKKDFKKILYPENSDKSLNINDTCFAQPLIFLIEYSLARLLIELGIRPNYMIGHSIGEYAAACISGVFTFEQSLKLVVKRGQLMHSLPSGVMISVPIDEFEAKDYLNGEVSLAAINAPKQVVFSGNHDAINTLTEKLTAKDIPWVKLHTSHAFHSNMQDSILKEFEDEFKNVEFNPIQIPFVSNLTGDFIENQEVSSSNYWANQLRNSVRFAKGIEKLIAENNPVFIEVGAGSSLTSLIKQCKTANDIKTVNLVRSVKVSVDDHHYFTDKLGELWCHGVDIKWKMLYKEQQRNKISLPTYAFDKTTYATEVDVMKLLKVTNHQFTLNNLEDSFYFPSWRRSMLMSHAKNDAKVYLHFCIDNNFAAEMKVEITALDNKVIEVFSGEDFIKHASFRYSINPLESDHYNQLFEDLKDEGIKVNDIIYSWPVNVNNDEIIFTVENLEYNLIYFSLVKIIKTWGQNSNKNMYVLTNLLHQVIGNESVNYKQSLLLGLLNVIPQETQISAINIDFDLNEKRSHLIKNITAEILNNEMKEERIVSFRLNQRWVRDFQNITQKTNEIKDSNIKKNGTYFITGGLGKLGFLLSKHLIVNYQAKVIVTGRKKLSEIHENEIYNKRYNELKSLSDDLVYLNINVTEIDELKEKVSEYTEMFESLNGIVHLAGNVDNEDLEFIENTSFDKTLNILTPKVQGIENVYEVFNNYNLDFIWISSSIAAILGGISLGAYAAANSYLDYFSFSKSGCLKCVELPRIVFDESSNNNTQNTLSPDEVIEVFEKSLNSNTSNVIYVSKEDISSILTDIFGEKEEEDFDNKQSKDKIERPVLETEYLSPQTDTERKVKAIFEDFFEIIDIGTKDDFFELGGDSLKAMVLIKKINKEFNIEISISDFLYNKDIMGLAAIIDEKEWLNVKVEYKNEIII